MILAKIPSGNVWDFWTIYAPGIWYVEFAGVYPLIDDEFETDIPIAGIVDITSVVRESTTLSRITDLANILTAEDTFYFSNNTLYVHLDEYDRPKRNTMKVSFVIGFADEVFADIENNVLYEPRLLSSVKVKKEKDNIFFQKIRYKPFVVEIANGDDEQNGFISLNVANQQVELLYVEDVIFPTDGLIGLWNLDDGAGLIAEDKSGYGNDGDLEGTMTDADWVPGVKKTGLNFAGVNQRLNVGNASPISTIGNGSFAFAFWMKSPDSVPLNYGGLVEKFISSSEAIIIDSVATTNQLRVYLAKGGATATKNYDAAPFDTAWNHIWFVADRSADLGYIYLNNVVDAQVLDLSSLPADISNSQVLTFGARHNGTQPAEIIQDEIYVFNRVPTAQERADIFGIYPWVTEAIRTGRLTSYQFKGEQLNILCDDQRKRFESELPVNTFTVSAFADLNPSNGGKFIPIRYGTIRGAEVVCTNEDESSPASYSFTVADVADHANGIKAIDTVYVNGVQKTPTGTNLTTATFTLLTGDFSPGDEVTVDMRGYVDGSTNLIDKLDILSDILAVYLGIPFNSSFYNLTEWNAGNATALKLGIEISKTTRIKKIIEDVQGSMFQGFDFDPDGLITWRVFDDTASSVLTIESYEFKGLVEATGDFEEAISSVVLRYNKHQKNGNYDQVRNDDNETDYIDKYIIPNEKKFSTVLVDTTEVTALASTISDRYKDVQVYANGAIAFASEHLDINQGDVITATIDSTRLKGFAIETTTLLGTNRFEVLSIAIDFDIKETIFNLRKLPAT